MNISMMSVNALNIKIKSLLEATFIHIKVEGEIASVTYHQASGHIYFSIKDDKSSIKCVMFRSNAKNLKFKLQKGERVVVDGSVGVYTPRGEYQFYVTHVEPFGKGALALAYEQLKIKLKQRGYFDKDNKKSIPKHIERIALVTAKDSAALHDMIKIAEHRYPLVEITIIDSLVQGDKAAQEISQALYYADSIGVDVIIVGRGGGSTEDLWAFNEEVVADAIFSLKTPVVSAVGHEIDVMISDFVSDLRAPTPSAAMEMILPDRQELLYALDEYIDRFSSRVDQIIYLNREKVVEQNESLKRYSIDNRLRVIEDEFYRLSSEYDRVMSYHLQQSSLSLLRLSDSLYQQISHISRYKSKELHLLSQQYSSNNPKNSIKKGWGKVSVDGKTIQLSDIQEHMRFVIEDSDTKIEAICQQKNRL